MNLLSHIYAVYWGVSLEIGQISNNKHLQRKNIQTWCSLYV
jgi:hypothetical protein